MNRGCCSFMVALGSCSSGRRNEVFSSAAFALVDVGDFVVGLDT